MTHPFVLLTTQRSGSTWVIDMLNSHPSVVAYSELLLEGARGKPKWGGAKDLGFWNDYYETEIGQRAGATRQELLFAYLDLVFAPRSDRAAAGFKLMYGQFGAFPELLEYMRAQNVAVIHLIRENLLDVLLSKEVAAQRDVWHSKSEQPLETITIDLNTRQLLTRLESGLKEIERAKRIFADSDLPYLEVTYEELASDSGGFRRLLRFLGVDERSVNLNSSLRRLNKGSHRKIIANYQEVAEELRETPFERLLR